MGWWSFKPYVSVAERRAKAAREIKKLEKKGRKTLPVHIEGKTIARTFWGKAWCDHLESYSDYDNRLPRGRTYVRNGSVCDLQIEPGRITAMVCGSELYKIKIGIKPLPQQIWNAVKRQCAGQIGSMIELLQGKLSQGVMQIITRRDAGLFPKPAEIELDCSCPDWADMCKHVAAALYGVGARLDERPELLFVLRQVNHLDLIGQAGDINALTKGKSGKKTKTIAVDQLPDVFGIELDGAVGSGSTRAAVAASSPAKVRPPKLAASPIDKSATGEKKLAAERTGSRRPGRSAK